MICYFCKTCKKHIEVTETDKRHCPYCGSESLITETSSDDNPR